LSHGVTGVEGQVHEYLVDLARIRPYGAQPGREDQGQANVLPDKALQQIARLGDHDPEVQQPGLDGLPAAEGQQLPG
jgi:hypothetical protein